MTDEQLMMELQQGHYTAAGELYDRYKRKLMGYFFNSTQNVSASEDMVQQTFEKILRYKNNFSQKGTFRSWLFTVARNVMIDFFNDKKPTPISIDERHAQLEGGINLLERNETNNHTKIILQRAFAHLSQDKRELISFVKLQGMEYTEAATIYNTTVGNIKVKVYRIMKELQQIMKDNKYDNYG